MTRHIRSQCTAAAFVTVVLATHSAAQSASPWQRVPTAPTSCFADDDFEAKVSRAKADVEAEIVRQIRINAEVKKRFDALDESIKAQRIRAFMISKPIEATRMVLAEHAAGSGGVSDFTKSSTDASTLDQQLARHHAAFTEAVMRALKPIVARQLELVKTRTLPAESSLLWKTKADQTRYNALIQQENAEYEKVCAPYLRATGVFATWLKNYRTQAIEPAVAAADADEARLVTQMNAVQTNSDGYRSTATLEGVRDYLAKYSAVYRIRRHRAPTDSSPISSSLQ